MTNRSKSPRATAARDKRLHRFAIVIAMDVVEAPEDQPEWIGHGSSDNDVGSDHDASPDSEAGSAHEAGSDDDLQERCADHEAVSDDDLQKMWAAAGYDVPKEFEIQVEPGWNSGDSGYGSRESSPDSEPTPEEINYDQLSFKKKHYLHTYVVRTLEAACLKYAQERLAELLGDLEWKRRNIVFNDPEYPEGSLAYRDWLEEDQIELKSWANLFERVGPTGCLRKSISESVKFLRNATMHRGQLRDDKIFTYWDYFVATRLADFLKDQKAASEIKEAFAYVTGDQSLDDVARARVEAALYTPRICKTQCQLLTRIQTLIEESCFDYAHRKIQHVLVAKKWEMPEQVELPEWCNTYDMSRVRHDESANDIFPSMNDWSLRNLLHDARCDIRNPAAHYGIVSTHKLVYATHVAIQICILQADWHRAIEIEVLAESYFTDFSRDQVLDRLESVYRVGPVENKYEQGRRVAIFFFLENEGRGQGDDDGTTVEELEMVDPETRWTRSPSMHGLLMRKRQGSQWCKPSVQRPGPVQFKAI